ncbi:hypothetical protein I302_106210 [Kwoniella bestiolae CBS 10118]|uniref:MYND-type domain-containing protein n=1 Tax=Kwoniella bestiolae CBS 10118 TaxID=1296100 RepID=A0A1B9G3A7_9TREE|nr:hypothetical protein I302_05335 [Kwoniella bestiolae CBS 10118]OCF25515.1 hypothetical protein I302_05335 [Kwoniella bestiolae CBS 10118]
MVARMGPTNRTNTTGGSCDRTSNLTPVKGERKVVLSEIPSPVEKGDTIHTTTPLLPTLNSALLSTHCSGCLKSAQQLSEELELDLTAMHERMLKCSRCQVHVFCSVKCYASTWCILNDECRGLANNAGWVPCTFPRMVAKVLTARRFGNQLYDPLPYHPDPGFSLSTKERQKIQDNVIQLLGKLQQEGGETNHHLQLYLYHINDIEEFSSLIKRISSCQFTLYDTSANPVGIALSPGLSMIRHSCKPNAQIVFHDGPNEKEGMKLVANRMIYPGEEALPVHLRQNALAPFGFDHSQICPYCSVKVVDCRWAATHPSCTLGGLVPLTPMNKFSTSKDDKRECDRCPESVSTEQFEQRYKQLLDLVEEPWKREEEGVSLPPDTESIQDEIKLLSPLIPKFLQICPDVVYPIPHLQLRYGRLLSTLPQTIPIMRDTIESYTQSYTSFLSLNHNLSTPMTCFLAFGLARLHLEILHGHKDLQERKSQLNSYSELGKKSEVMLEDVEGNGNGDGNENEEEIESYLREGQDWVQCSTDHLDDLGYTSSKKFKLLKMWKMEFEELVIWFDCSY